MALDFQQVREKVHQLGENAPQREQELKDLRGRANTLLDVYAQDLERLRAKVALAVAYDPSLRCALPASEALSIRVPVPALPGHATLLAADGSQIAPSRHEPVEYSLINVGAIRMQLGSPEAPVTTVECQLLYDLELEGLTDATLALKRDLNERKKLAELAETAAAPVITMTDGQMELGIGRPGDSEESSEFRRSLREYLDVLRHLWKCQAITAGYVDKPSAKTVVRMLEVAMTAEPDLPEIKTRRPLRGVSDVDLYRRRLQPGERSAVFGLQSQFANVYEGPLGLHFFYINVGRLGRPGLARVEIPAWVAQNAEMLAQLHAVLVSQCHIMGSRPYPYLLHRAHEAAVVTLDEKEQVTQMILLELRRRGVDVGEASYKQAAKDLRGRTSYKEHS